MKKTKSLGKSLENLFNKNAMPTFLNKEVKIDSDLPSLGDQLTELNLEALEISLDQPRKVFDEEKLTELASSIKNQGIIQPIVVTPSDHGTYVIIAGERRYRAAKLAGLEKVPVVIKKLDQTNKILIALIENIQREDLSPLEKAQGYYYAAEVLSIKHNDLALMLGLSRSAVSNTLRLLKLDVEVQELLNNNKISEGHAKILAGFTAVEQKKLAQKIIKYNLTVRELEKISLDPDEIKTQKKVKKTKSNDLVRQLEELFLTRVEVSDNGKGKGKVVLYYNTRDELDGLVQKLMKEVEYF